MSTLAAHEISIDVGKGATSTSRSQLAVLDIGVAGRGFGLGVSAFMGTLQMQTANDRACILRNTIRQPGKNTSEMESKFDCGLVTDRRASTC